MKSLRSRLAECEKDLSGFADQVRLGFCCSDGPCRVSRCFITVGEIREIKKEEEENKEKK